MHCISVTPKIHTGTQEKEMFRASLLQESPQVAHLIRDGDNINHINNFRMSL